MKFVNAVTAVGSVKFLLVVSGREEADLCVWVQPVQVRRLLNMVGLVGTCYNNYLWKIVVDVVVVTNVVHVWRRCKPLRVKFR